MSKRFWFVLLAVILIVFGWLWFQYRPVALGVFPEEIKEIRYSPKGTYILARSDNNLFVWQLNSEPAHRIYRGSKLHLCDIALCPNDRYLAISCGNSISIVEVRNGHINQEIRLPEAGSYFYVVSSMVFSPDGKRLAVSASAIPFRRGHRKSIPHRLWIYDLPRGKDHVLQGWKKSFRERSNSQSPVWVNILGWQQQGLVVQVGAQESISQYWGYIDPGKDRIVGKLQEIGRSVTLQAVLPNGGLIGVYVEKDKLSDAFVNHIVYLYSTNKTKTILKDPLLLSTGFEEPVGVSIAHNTPKICVFGFTHLSESYRQKQILKTIIWLIDPIRNERQLVMQGSVSAKVGEPILRVALSPDARWLAYRSLTNPYQIVLKKIE
jgi:hypothetical protein